MEKKWEDVSSITKVKPSNAKRNRSSETRAGYYQYIKDLEKLCPDEELRAISDSMVTKRKNVDWDNICRVVPAEWITLPELLSMNKENNIYPEMVIKDMYHEIKNKIIRGRL